MNPNQFALQQQVVAARKELEVAVAGGAQMGVEQVLADYPDLTQHAEIMLELIYLEFVLRQEAGRQPLPAEYHGRFPQLSMRLAKLFEFERLLESSWSGPETLSETASHVATPSQSAPLVNDRSTPDLLASIGDYDCVGVIGHGGMGLVYRAIHRTLHRSVAIKVLSQLAGSDDQSTERFINEARICGRLNHPHIVQVYDSGIDQGIPYLVMEYMPGGSLQDVLRDGPLDAKVAAHVVRTLAQAVAYAHGQAIVHRDLKPGNVLIAPKTGETGIRLRSESAAVDLKIADFGLAKCLSEPWTQTRTGTPVGTPAYMAPEQIGQATEVDGRCDVYSLGALLYHLLVGKPPFQAATVIETWQLVQHESPMSIRSLQPSVTRDLETICLKCLEKEPQRRYASADELGSDLQCYLEGRPILARPVGLSQRWLRWARRNPEVTVLGCSILIAALMTTALWLRAESYRRMADRANVVSQQANQQTLEALRKLTSTVVLRKFAQQDQLSSQDRIYLEEIAKLYEQLAQLPLSGVDADQIRGEGHYWSGVVYLRLADAETAIDHFNAAIKLLTTIELSSKSEVVTQLINESMELIVEALETDNQIDEAIAVTQQRIIRCQNPHAFVSSEVRLDCQRSIIAGYRQLGHLNDLHGDSVEALASWHEAHRLIEAALRSAPKDFKLLSALAGTLRSMASVETEPQLQLSLSSQSIEVARLIAAEYSDQPDSSRQLAWTLFDRAVLLRASQRFEEALELTDEAIEIAQILVDHQPLMDEYRGPLAVYIGLRGQLLNGLGRFQEAEESLIRSIELLQRNLETSPQAAMVHVQHARNWVQLLKAQHGYQSASEVLKQTRESAEEALAALREVLQASGADLDKYHQMKRDLDALQAVQ